VDLSWTIAANVYQGVQIVKVFLKNSVSAFALDQRGATAMFFALSFLPAIMLVGSAIDISKALREKSKQQSILDAAVLQVAPMAATKTKSEIKTAATAAINALRGVDDTSLPADSTTTVGGVTTTTVNGVTVNAAKSKTCLTASTNVSTSMMGIFAINTLSVNGTSCAEVGGNYYEIAMVLDNSGSMNNSSKIGSLRTAATSFVNNMFTLAPSNVSISIVPFSDSVAVDPTAYRTAAWVDTLGQSSWHWKSPELSAFAGLATSRFDLYNKLKAVDSNWDWKGCFETQPYPQNVQDSLVPRQCKKSSCS
jgi:Flp pilus assembly protein TadG